VAVPGYLVIPAPNVYPGLGKVRMLMDYGGNILDTNVDAFVVVFTGVAEGYTSSVEGIFVIPKYFTCLQCILMSKNLVSTCTAAKRWKVKKMILTSSLEISIFSTNAKQL